MPTATLPATPDALDLALASAALEREFRREAPSRPVYDEVHHARIFGEGCDARLYGWSLSDNPYPSDSPDYYEWRRGWSEVSQHYAEMVGGRWPVRELPPVSLSSRCDASSAGRTP